MTHRLRLRFLNSDPKTSRFFIIRLLSIPYRLYVTVGIQSKNSNCVKISSFMLLILRFQRSADPFADIFFGRRFSRNLENETTDASRRRFSWFVRVWPVVQKWKISNNFTCRRYWWISSAAFKPIQKSNFSTFSKFFTYLKSPNEINLKGRAICNC